MTQKGVIANSFPKSGTHLLTEILTLLGYGSAKTHLSRSLILYGPRNFLRNIIIYSRLEKQEGTGFSVDLENPTRLVKEEWFERHLLKELSSTKYTQAHLPYSRKLEHHFYHSGNKMLYIHRHPLDVLVSLKNYILKKENYPNHKMIKACKSDERRYFLLLDGYNKGSNIDLMAPFFEKYKHSIGWTRSKSVCSVTFEHLIGEKGGGTRSIQKEALIKVLKYLGEDLGKLDLLQSKIFNPQSPTFHKGTIGQWREELSDVVLDYCKQKMKETELNTDEYLGYK